MEKVLNVGIDLKPPERECNDKKCAWHGEVRVRGKIFKGIVISDKMQKTVTVYIPRIVKIKKYERFLKKKTKIKAHNPPCINARLGDIVIVGETRKLSKTKSFVVLSIVGKATLSEIMKLIKKVPPHLLESKKKEVKNESGEG